MMVSKICVYLLVTNSNGNFSNNLFKATINILGAYLTFWKQLISFKMLLNMISLT
jgi:hypothetical protein